MAYTEYKTSIQNNYGFPLTFDATGKLPLISKRIWNTKADAQGFVDDADSAAIAGLVLTVINDDASNNGVYFVESAVGDNGATVGKLVKLGESSSAEEVKDALDNLIAACGVDSVSAVTNALADTEYVSGDTTIINAIKTLDEALKALDDETIVGSDVVTVTKVDSESTVALQYVATNDTQSAGLYSKAKQGEETSNKLDVSFDFGVEEF